MKNTYMHTKCQYSQWLS